MIRFGQFTPANPDVSRVFIAHGGAGPQDPKGREIISAANKMQEILSSIQVSKDIHNYTFLNNEWTEISEVDRAALSLISQLEDEPMYNAGRGASIQADGVARLSAAYMNSRSERLSGLINAKNVSHPGWIAWWLQRKRFSLLDSLGADHLIRELNIPRTSVITERRFQRWVEHKESQLRGDQTSGQFSTVGSIVGLGGNLSVITSTGGVGNETPGRIGDSPTIAGTYCNQSVAISCTGVGEQITGFALAPRIALYLEETESLHERFKKVFSAAEKKNYQFAAIALRRKKDGVFEWAAGASHCELTFGVRMEISPSQTEIVTTVSDQQ